MAVRPVESKEEKEEMEIEIEAEEDSQVFRGGDTEKKKDVAKDERVLVKIGDPRLPSEAEVEEHYKAHLPYRDWCPHCVRARGKDLDHRRAVEEERGLNEYSFDFCFPGDEMGYKLTILVGVERSTGMKMSTSVPTKGASGRFMVDKAIEFIEECGNGKNDSIIVKSDQEEAIKYFTKDLREVREGKTILEESPVQSHGSNGGVERGVQSVEGQVRTMKLGLEERLGMDIDAEERIVHFLPEYASYLLNRLEVGKDGKTSYERTKGKKATVLGVEFGEKLFWKKKAGQKMEKINARWEYGIFVGVKRASGEVWVATPDGIRKARSVKRIPKEQRWGPDCVKWVKHAPWNRYPGAADADGEIPEDKLVEAASGSAGPLLGGAAGRVVINVRQPRPRDFHIRKEDAEKHGYTKGCSGCSSWFRGLARQPHSNACRERFRELLKGDAKMKNAEKRKQEFDEKVAKKVAKKEIKQAEKERKRRQEDQGGRDQEQLGQEGDEKQGQDEEMAVELEEELEEDSETEEETACRLAEKPIKMWINEVSTAIEEAEGEDDMEFEGGQTAWDDVHGEELDLKLVRKGRKEEIDYMEFRGIWEVCDEEEAWRETGQGPTSTKWVDTNKGTKLDPLVRCRLVARDFRKKGDKDREDLFAATPPLETIRILLSKAATRRLNKKKKKLMFIDAKKAHINPECNEKVYIKLPEECGVAKGKCGRLKHWLYGFS